MNVLCFFKLCMYCHSVDKSQLMKRLSLSCKRIHLNNRGLDVLISHAR